MKTLKKNALLFLFVSFISACSYDNSGYNNFAMEDMGEIQESEKYAEYDENPFIKAIDEPVSTFSVDADGGSYANMRRFMRLAQKPPKEAVRIEEFLNYFTFDYAEPQNGENVALNSEIAVCPWNTEHYLMRVGMKGKSITENQIPNSNFVFLIDVSGSMSSPDKLGVLKAGFKMMTDELRDNDVVSIVTYAGEAAVLLKGVKGNEKSKIKKAIDKLGAGGSTAGAQGLITAYEIALENFIVEGNNRIIIGSDGDFNVGPSSVKELIELVENKRESGVYITVLGVGSGNLNDHMMEQIANKGNGNYEYIDSSDELVKIFINEKARFFTVAKDSKIQISFNPERVESYRLIGYENRKLENDDFENDSTDAGEIGATQTITALYEIIPAAGSSGKFAQFDFRYKKPNETESRLMQHEINSAVQNITTASANMRFASSVAAFGLIICESQYKGSANRKLVLDLANGATTFDPFEYRRGFLAIVNKWRE